MNLIKNVFLNFIFWCLALQDSSRKSVKKKKKKHGAGPKLENLGSTTMVTTEIKKPRMSVTDN